MPHVLVSGAGIAGATTAYWLRHHGFAVTVVERAPAPRPGGQAVDVRGVAREIAARMGVLDALRAARTGMRGVSFVDDDGAEVWSTTEASLTGGPTDGPDVEILRDDLTDVLLGTVPDDVEIRWGDRITALRQDDDGVTVALEHGGSRRFDVVLGADGVGSAVRRLAFGPDAAVAHPLGSHIAVFTAANEFGLDRWQTFRQTPGTLAGAYAVRDNREVRVVLGFERDPAEVERLAGRDPVAQKRLVADAFDGAGWWLPRLLELMTDAPDFYFDSMAQIRMPSWSSGRVSLVGDAGYCATPVSGQGTTLAMTGAYLVAGELATDPADPAAALRRAEDRMRDWVRTTQDFALDAAERTRAAVESAASTSDATISDTTISDTTISDTTMSDVGDGLVVAHAAEPELPDYGGPVHR